MDYLLLLLVTLQAWRTHVLFCFPPTPEESTIHVQECRDLRSSEHKAQTLPHSPRSESFMGSWWELIEVICPSCSPKQPREWLPANSPQLLWVKSLIAADSPQLSNNQAKKQAPPNKSFQLLNNITTASGRTNAVFICFLKIKKNNN